MQQQANYYNLQDELDEELTIDLKKIIFAIWNGKELIIKVFVAVLVLFIALTFILPKKYIVTSDLYINKANSTNLVDINPYAIDEISAGIGGMSALMSGGTSLSNEIELMKSPLVLDKVIQENDIKIKKIFGFITTKKTGQYAKADKFVKKITIENKKGTNVISISYKSKNKDLAYGVVSSLIKNYIELHKELHQQKAEADKQILETEYKKAKTRLDKKIGSVSGLPSSAITNAGNLSAMSAFSKSAQSAMSSVQAQYIAGERSKFAVTEDAKKVAELSSKLEWVKLVHEMSDSSKVLILKAPQELKDYEQASPKLFMQIILGIVFGVIIALIVFIFKEITDNKLTYSMLGDNIIYNLKKDFSELKLLLLTKQDKNIAVVALEKLDNKTKEKLSEFDNLSIIQAEISQNFIKQFENIDAVMILAKINNTNSKEYKQIKQILKDINKNIIREILI